MAVSVGVRVSRPALERLADRVAAGQVLARPEWAGCFIWSVRRRSGDRQCGLIVDSDPMPAGRVLFVWARRPPAETAGPFYNPDLIHDLGGRWSFQCED